MAQTGTVELIGYSEVGTQTLPDVPALVLVNVDPTGGDLQKLLSEYLDRATNIARWQKQLDSTSDPALRGYFAGLIAAEKAILADIAAAARAAGATSAQLEELDRLANEAAAGDPIALAAGATQADLDEIADEVETQGGDPTRSGLPTNTNPNGSDNTNENSESSSQESASNKDSASIDPDRVDVLPTIGIYSDGTHAWVQCVITVAVPPGHQGPPTPYVVKIELFGPGWRKDAAVPALIGVPALATLSVTPGSILPSKALHVRFEDGDAGSFSRLREFMDRYTEKGFMTMLNEAMLDETSKSNFYVSDFLNFTGFRTPLAQRSPRMPLRSDSPTASCFARGYRTQMS